MALAAALVLKCRAGDCVPDPLLLRPALAAVAQASGCAVARIAAHAAHESAEVYAYLWLRLPQEAGGRPLPGFDGVLAGMPATVCALVQVAARPGASAGAEAPFHYVVEFDIETAHQAEVYDWYDNEHLGGLAAVPGTVRAQRFFNLGAGPWSYACYDLVSLDTHDSPPWLAVRRSEWSSRVRPHFRNIKRTMFRRLFDSALD